MGCSTAWTSGVGGVGGSDADRDRPRRSPPPSLSPPFLSLSSLRAEYQMIGMRVSMGIVAMGFVGFFVKLVFIPIKSIIVGL